MMRNRTGSASSSTSDDHSPIRRTEKEGSTMNITTTTSSSNSSTSSRSLLFSPRGKAVASMSFALAIHLGGYELARAAVMALFTSDGLGFGKKDNNSNQESELSALPMAVGCVSPFSVLLLWFYGKTLSHGGPSYALSTNTIICAAAQIFCGYVLRLFEACIAHDDDDDADGVCTMGSVGNVKTMSQILLFILFVFQSAYVQLLYAQHWAFISSVLTPDEGSKLFAPIAGLGSIGSTLAAGSVSILVDRVGLIGLMYMAGTTYIFCALLANLAFSTAKSNGFEPASGNKAEKNDQPQSSSSTSGKGAYAPINNSGGANTSQISTNSIPCLQKNNIFQQAYALFHRVPVLGALFVEVVVSQCLSSLVNYIYLYKLKVAITDDALRAGWSGKFYAWINGISGVLQFFIIPLLLKYCEAHRLWLFMPSLMLICTLYQFGTYQKSGLFGASASFFCIKTMEYSLRGAANEMLYVSLDYESRYLGKKVVSLIAGKFGKSSMAIALAVSMIVYGDHDNFMFYLLATASIFTVLWLLSSVRLHSLIDASKQ